MITRMTKQNHSYPGTETDGELVSGAIDNLAQAVYRLGTADAATPLGALEMLALEVRNGSRALAEGLNNISTSLDAVADAIREHGE